MVQVGTANFGHPDYPLKELNNGLVVPDLSVSAIHRKQQRQLKNQIDFAIEAENLGYDYYLQPEHHFSFLGAVSPNPVVAQMAIAAQTDEIRLMQMANILPWHEPVRLAEQIGMLDIVSDGRVEVGIGRGAQSLEAGTLGQYWGASRIDRTKNRHSFEEKYELLLEAWTKNFASHRGTFHDVPPRYTEWENDQEYFYLADDVSGHAPSDYLGVDGDATTLQSLTIFPQTQQDPHPQVWKPAMSPSSMEWTARRGINACCHCTDFSEIKTWIDAYYEAAEEADWPDRRPAHDGEPFARGWDADRQRGVVVILTAFNTEVADEETFERWKLGQEIGLVDTEELRSQRETDDELEIERRIDDADALAVGDGEEIANHITELLEVCEYRDPIVFLQTKVPGMTHEENLTQIRLLAEEVVPSLEDRFSE